MFWNRLNFLLIIAFASSVFSGCASKKISPRAVTPGLESGVPLPFPLPSQGGTEPQKPPERFSITLVLGGAGVASFGTVGLLKRFEEEGIQVQSIVTTGWTTPFVLAYGFQKSVHDVEWFATRLGQADFYPKRSFPFGKPARRLENVSSLFEQTFGGKELQNSRIPVTIVASNFDFRQSVIADRGDWHPALLTTLSFPGLNLPIPEEPDALRGVEGTEALSIDEAIRHGANFIVAVQMYDDFFHFMASSRKTGDEFRKAYRMHLKERLEDQLQRATVVGRIYVAYPPGDLSARRKAIRAGYEEGMRLSKVIKEKWK
jgi:predicted acylesterase/phospholipase RssA